MKKKFDYLIYIGRFSPMHSGHVHVIRKALEQSENLIIVVGSDKKALDIRNPFPTKFRIDLIRASLTKEESNRIFFAPQVDYTYNDDRWISAIQSSVSTVISNNKWTPDPIKIGIVGYDKDHTSYYLKKFPQWELIQIAPINMQHSTDFRKYLFEGNKLWAEYCTTTEASMMLLEWMKSDSYIHLADEYEFIKDYKKQWEKSPYPPTFITVDAVVQQSGHVLLVVRDAKPGQGLWALPGGFVNQNETLEEAVFRELDEETNIDVPKKVLKGSLINRMTFDDPHRSVRGRTISEAFQFKLNESFELPKVKRGDDARHAFWVSFADVVKNRDKFFEDHYAILSVMIGL